MHVDTLVVKGVCKDNIRIQCCIFVPSLHRNRFDNLARFLSCEIRSNLLDHAPLDVPSGENTHARQFGPNQCFTISLRGVVIQPSPVWNVSVVGNVHFKSNDSARCRGLDCVVDGFIHRDLHIIEFLHIDRDLLSEAEACQTSACIRVGFLGICLEDDSVGACFNLVRDVDLNIELLLSIAGKFEQTLSRNFNVPNHVNTCWVGDSCEAVIESIRTVSVVCHRGWEDELLARVHCHNILSVQGHHVILADFGLCAE